MRREGDEPKVEAQKLSIGIGKEGLKRILYSGIPRNTSTGVSPEWKKRHLWAGTLNMIQRETGRQQVSRLNKLQCEKRKVPFGESRVADSVWPVRRGCEPDTFLLEEIPLFIRHFSSQVKESLLMVVSCCRELLWQDTTFSSAILIVPRLCEPGWRSETRFSNPGANDID